MSRTVDLHNRGQRTILVKHGSAIVSDAVARKYSQVIDANPLIVTYPDAYADDLEAQLMLDEDKLPPALFVSTLLNPLFGLEAKIVGLGLMTQDQYTASRKLVVSMMHDIIDKCTVVMVEESSSEKDSSDDDVITPTENASYTRANTEFTAFEKLKRKKYMPVLAKSEHGSLNGEYGGKSKELWVAPVASKGKDLPSGKNLADYINYRGQMQLLKFFADHHKSFPTLWILMQKEASHCVVEVRCERIFGLSGYVSSPWRTRLGVQNYE
jgi:hypothetical protein